MGVHTVTATFVNLNESQSSTRIFDNSEIFLSLLSLSTLVKIYISVFTILPNLIVFITGVRRHAELSRSSLLIASLSFVDLIVGSVVMPLGIYSEMATMETWMCELSVAMATLFRTLSIVYLFVISLDQYVSITHPFKYSEYFSNAAFVIITLIVWSLAVILASVPIILRWTGRNGNYHDKNVDSLILCQESHVVYDSIYGIVVFFIPVLTMIGLYFRIARIARRQVGLIRRASVTSNDSCHSVQRPVEKHKATKVLLVLMSCLVFRWGPYFVVSTFFPMFNITVSANTYQILLCLGYSKSSTNPILYAGLNPEMRGACFEVCGICCKWNSLYVNKHIRTCKKSRETISSQSESSSSSPEWV